MPQYMNHLFRLATRSPARSEMTSARIEVPTGVERIILSLSNGSSEVQELRRRVKDVEVRCDIDRTRRSLMSMLPRAGIKRRSHVSTKSASSRI